MRRASSPPPFPAAAEARIKHASIALLLSLRREFTAMAAAHRQPVATSHAPLTSSLAAAGRDAGRHLRSQRYQFLLARETERASRLAARHASAVAGWDVPLATAAPAVFSAAAWDKAEEMMDGMAECMAARLEEWLAGGFPDEALDASLQECQDAHASRWYFWLTLMFGWLVGNITTETYQNAGVIEAEWHSRDDRRVRPAHHALHGALFRYDGPPPLKAADSSNGEDCYPGDDYNCRCTARIVSVRAREIRQGAASRRIRAA